MIDYKSFFKMDIGTLPQCAEALNKWMSENGVHPLSVETLWGATGGVSGIGVRFQELGLRVWFTR